ncbi:hypothetical protein B0H66DRAFT_625122 [Apodospora peruviana]|uniref:Glycosyl transferase n=1 Tax=Apodospora peruviana TaxID=516989 RepID=A0AAE0M2A5_9PEZI|nr:hypothetical protein B0H66DRAFT_625122 [Apodospora peruviana]
MVTVAFRYVRMVILSALFFAYLLFPSLYRIGDYVRQTNPWSGQKYVELAFSPIQAELACLYGHPIPGADSHYRDEHGVQVSTARTNTTAVTEPIPNIVHFIFGLQNPLRNPQAGHFDFLCYLAVRSAIVSLRPDTIYLHYTYLPSDHSNNNTNVDDPMNNPWIRRLSKHIRLIHHPPPATDNNNIQYSHLSDMMRLQFLLEKGGIYLDMDAFALRSFHDLLNPPAGRDVVLGHEGGNRWGLCNGIMAARPNSTFVSRWLASYEHVDFSREWNYHSVRLPKKLAGLHPSEICALAPDAFFWPTWTWRHVHWMHEELDTNTTQFWQEKIDRHGGSLFGNQVAYHAWSQMAWDRHLSGLTPEVVRRKDTRFNLLVRQFMEEDL